MAKVLLVIAVTFLIVLLLKNATRRRELPKGEGRAAKAGEAKVEDMVRCHVCGVNLPRSEAIMSRGRFYCGEEHRSQNGA